MDCCGRGHTVAHDPFIWGIPLAPIGAMLAGEVGPLGSTEAARTAEDVSATLDVLRKSISFDVHSHGGSTGITSKAPPSGDLANAMRAGSLAVACLADVPDWPVLGRNAEGALAMVRAPALGELYRYHLDRLAWLDELIANHGISRALCAANGDRRVEPVEVDLGNADPLRARPGTVDEAIDPTEPSHGLSDHRLHVRLDGQIGWHEAGALTQSPRKLFTPFAPTSGDYDSSSLFNEQRRSACADAARSAGDDRDLPFKRQHGIKLRWDGTPISARGEF
jgi:hypothetical protein